MVLGILGNLFSLLFFKIQVSKKEKLELIKKVTITPSASTHFRVILSSEAMETEIERGDSPSSSSSSSVCTIVKPKPRTPMTTITPLIPLDSDDIIPPGSPLTPTEPLDVLPPNVTTSTPSNSQLSDSPSKKKGMFGGPFCCPLRFGCERTFTDEYLCCWIKVSQSGASTRVRRISTSMTWMYLNRMLLQDISLRG